MQVDGNVMCSPCGLAQFSGLLQRTESCGVRGCLDEVEATESLAKAGHPSFTVSLKSVIRQI